MVPYCGAIKDLSIIRLTATGLSMKDKRNDTRSVYKSRGLFIACAILKLVLTRPVGLPAKLDYQLIAELDGGTDRK